VPVSVVVLTLNEEVNLPGCLKSVAWCDDVVVLDSYSTDRTEKIARAAGARFIQRQFDSFAAQRNYAIENVSFKHDWVLLLDADEVIPPELATEIQSAIASAAPDVAGFFLCYKTVFNGRWLKHSSTFPVWVLRLVREGRVRYLERGHGEDYEAKGTIGYIHEPYLHYNFSKGMAEWFDKHNRYSTNEACAWVNEQRNVRIDWPAFVSRDPVRRRRALKEFSFRLPLRPWLKFFYMYLVRGGFLDGAPGLTYCVLQAIYEYMICIKIRELMTEQSRQGQGVDECEP